MPVDAIITIVFKVVFEYAPKLVELIKLIVDSFKTQKVAMMASMAEAV